MIIALVLLVVGLMLSAFFSGSETGFYRVTRVRLVLDAIDGDWISRGLLWLTNNPAMFVATALVGNNLANYVLSLGGVLLAGAISTNPTFEVVLPLVMSPFVFVYGELLPKNLFFSAPNSMLRRTGPVFLFFALLFLPLSALLWTLSRLLQSIIGQSPVKVQLTLARQELEDVLDEGHAVGILRPKQRALAQNLFNTAERPVGHICTPASRVVAVPLGTSKKEVYRLARRQNLSAIAVRKSKGREIIGYVTITDLNLDAGEVLESSQPLIDVSEHEPYAAALVRMRTKKQRLARVVTEDGRVVGIVDSQDLIAALLRPSG